MDTSMELAADLNTYLNIHDYEIKDENCQLQFPMEVTSFTSASTSASGTSSASTSLTSPREKSRSASCSRSAKLWKIAGKQISKFV